MLSETINTFKSRLDKFWQHQDMSYDFQAELNGTGSRSLPASLKLDGTTERPTEQQLANIWGETGHSRLIITRVRPIRRSEIGDR